MSAAEVGTVPDDVIEEVAQAVHGRDWPILDWAGAGFCTKERYRVVARDAISAPSVAEVFARDAKIREILDERAGADALDKLTRIRALYSEDQP